MPEQTGLAGGETISEDDSTVCPGRAPPCAV